MNPDGSKPQTQLAYDARANELFFVGDLAAYNKQKEIALGLAPGTLSKQGAGSSSSAITNFNPLASSSVRNVYFYMRFILG